MDIYDIWFAKIEIANTIKIRLLKTFSSEQIWNLSKEELRKQGLKECSINKIFDDENKRNLEKYHKYLEKNKINLFVCNYNEYPEKLKNISDYPAYIFMRRKYKFTL